MRLLALIAFVATTSLAPLAAAEVTSASPSMFVIETEADLAATPDRVWRDVTRVDRWWSSAHTYSGDASNLRLEPRAGGCWCERWGNGQSVEHMRVVAAFEHDGIRTLRTVGGLGPLQEMGVTGVMTFTITPLANGAKLTLTYRVKGDPALNLDAIAPVVDSVLMEQFERLRRLSTTGTPE